MNEATTSPGDRHVRVLQVLDELMRLQRLLKADDSGGADP